MEAIVNRFGFDPILQRLSEAPLSDCPLPLQRFSRWRAAPDPVVAMQGAVAELLAAVEAFGQDQGSEPQPSLSRELQPEMNRLVSVVEVCRYLGIRLTGAPATASRQRVYSLASPHAARREITGHLSVGTGGPLIYLPFTSDQALARLAAAHEIGHYLTHLRGTALDTVSWSLPSSPEEEALAEYAARLLLLPRSMMCWPGNYGPAGGCLHVAGTRCVTLHGAALRLRDEDVANRIARRPQAVILWRLQPRVGPDKPVAQRLTPQWFICPGAFVPVKRCHAGSRSLIAEIAEAEDGERPKEGSREEAVSIGSLRGDFHVDAFAWGSLRRGTRLVLSLFFAPSR